MLIATFGIAAQRPLRQQPVLISRTLYAVRTSWLLMVARRWVLKNLTATSNVVVPGGPAPPLASRRVLMAKR